MFIILLTYVKSIDEIDSHIREHRSFLDEGYQNNFFIVSGPRNPRTGGIIISQLNDRTQLENFLKNDPFQIHGLASYEIIEFTPVKHHRNFSGFIE
ncbi:MAG: YciI family protein [Pseudomonadota bacterium]|nr:YciI family protein [Pseudomonadota bacterium]